jgi:peptidoglycan/LPS O-acetylase OafA/YrhL
MLWHANVDVPGGFVGVDVFFVISGYLMTDLLIRSRRPAGAPKLLDFYGRRARRLLPASLVATLGVLVLTRLFLPEARWRSISKDALYSIGFSMNWREVSNSVDYLRFQAAPSPLQHYWSLGVEEQFYFFWPALLALVLWRQTKLTLARLLTIGLLAASFAWSVIATSDSPTTSYFSSFTRVWELLLGAVVGMFAPQLLKLASNRALATGLFVVGLGAIAYASAAFSTTTPFPSWRAAIPCVGAFLMLLAFGNAALGPFQYLVDSRPVQLVGDLSYSLYLWHWPLLVVATAKYGVLSAGEGLLVVALAFIPAIISYRYVEEPIRHNRLMLGSLWATFRTTGIAVMAATLAALLFLAYIPQPVAAADPTLTTLEPGTVTENVQKLGAAVLADDPLNDPAGNPLADYPSIFPDPSAPGASESGCEASTTSTDLVMCSYGPATGTNVVVFGDSHARQWMRPLTQLAVIKNWHVTEITKDFCLPADVKISSPWLASCKTWTAKALAFIKSSKPEVIITSAYDYRVAGANGKAMSEAASRAPMAAALEKTYATLKAQDAKVIVLRNTPQPARFSAALDIADCVSGHRHDLRACSFPRNVGNAPAVGAANVDAAKAAGAALIDLNDAICPTTQCAAVLAGILIYRDANHLTGAYAATLQPRLLKALVKAAPVLEGSVSS